MSSTSSSIAAGKKRERYNDDSATETTTGGSPVKLEENVTPSTTNFRNVSACNRCRNRKNRCDQQLPRCSGCLKAGVKCVGFDPVSKRTIPRSYVYYLETRVSSLESLLKDYNVPIPPPSDDFAINEAIKPGVNVPFPALQDGAKATDSAIEVEESALDPALHESGENTKHQKTEDVGMVSVQGASDPRHVRPTTSGIPFARVVFAAVRSSVPQNGSEKANSKPPKLMRSATASGGGGSDSFFGLNTKAGVKPAPFPDKSVALRLAQLYFEHANPQIPILHREEFMTLLDRVFALEARKRRPRELYLLNIVFAIGSGIIMHTPNLDAQDGAANVPERDSNAPDRKRPRLSTQQYQPEEYHSSAIVHLDSFLGSSPAASGAGGGLEELQAVLLLASLALLRPVAPGLWYIIGVAVRLAVDLGLHSEDVDLSLDQAVVGNQLDGSSSNGIGRRLWTRDLRRRLWWCTYTFDRLVSTCVGRPFGISDQVITTEFPSMLEDKYITPAGFLEVPQGGELPSYKLVARHYFRLRLLQSEILQVLQHRQAEATRLEAKSVSRQEAFMRTELPSAFMHGFDSFREWRADVDRRLLEWKDSAPHEDEIGVAFKPLFLELNYWQAIILLYQQSLAVPEPLVGELSPSTGEEVQSPGAASIEGGEDEQMVFMKVAQAGQTVLKIYRQLHRLGLVNYTFLATHHLFMSGISFLYAIWHSPLVRSQLTYDDVDFTVYIATSVLTDLISKCPPAEACRDAFIRMSKATFARCLSTTGFGNASTLGSQPLSSPGAGPGGSFLVPRIDASNNNPSSRLSAARPMTRKRMPMPQFDMNLKDLFSDDELANKPTKYQPKSPYHPHPPQSTQAHQASYEQPSPAQLGVPAESPMYASPDSSSTMSAAPLQQQHMNLPYHQSPYQQQQQPFTDPSISSVSSQQPDFSLDNLDFLDTFPMSDLTQSFWSGSGSGGVSGMGGSGGIELDLGFGTGGAAFDGIGGDWEASNGGVDLFDGFFFGNNSGSSY